MKNRYNIYIFLIMLVGLSFFGNDSLVRGEQNVNVQEEARVEHEGGVIEGDNEGGTFKVRAVGNSRAQAQRVAYEHAQQRAAGAPFEVVDERIYAEQNKWVCILTCRFV